MQSYISRVYIFISHNPVIVKVFVMITPGFGAKGFDKMKHFS